MQAETYMSQHVTFLDVIPVRILFSSMVRLGFLKYFLRDLFPHSRTSIPANIRLDKEMLKTSLRSLERNSFFVFPDVFKTSWKTKICYTSL